jgi:hypothetical protein
MSNLIAELLLRLAKAGVAAVLGLVVFVVAVALFGESPSVPLALLAWLAGAAFVLLVETSPL